MKRTIQLYFIISTFSFVSPTIAQFNLNAVSFQVGVIGGIATPDHVLYPKAQVGGFLGRPFIQWSLYWGYWDDGVDQVTSVDYITYSYSGHIVGTKIYFFPTEVADHWPVPIAFSGGIAHHFIHRTYVGGEDFVGTRGSEGAESSNTVEAGLGIYFKLTELIELRGEAHQFFRLGNGPVDEGQTDRRAYSVGFALLL